MKRLFRYNASNWKIPNPYRTMPRTDLRHRRSEKHYDRRNDFPLPDSRKAGRRRDGVVYKAEDTRLNRLVALKLLSATDADSDTARLRFLREAQAASAINHPNVATIYEIDEIEHAGTRFSFIAMEYVPGETLKSLRGQLAMDDLLDVFTQIASGLAEAHERGIVHRDLKPSNILITDIGEARRAKILDFGVAKFNSLTQASTEDDTNSETASLFHTNLMLTQPGTVLGTFAYMSPEQARGEDVDHRSDIFSFGVVFYEFLAGQLPFQGSSATRRTLNRCSLSCRPICNATRLLLQAG